MSESSKKKAVNRLMFTCVTCGRMFTIPELVEPKRKECKVCSLYSYCADEGFLKDPEKCEDYDPFVVCPNCGGGSLY